MDLRMFLFLLATLPGALSMSGIDMHFVGGSMMFEFINTTQSPFKLKITTLTGWVLGMGPCGPSCSSADIGRSTTKTRQHMMDLNGATYFGNWTKEVSFSRNTYTHIYEIITPEVIDNIEGHVTAVNVPMKWEQEIAEVIIDIDPTAEDIDISVSGSYWRWFNYTYGVRSYPTHYDLQISVNPVIREDTKKPNNSPKVIFKPVYRILLNKTTTIKLSTMDPDGDIVSCVYARFVEAGGLNTLNNTVVNPDCSIVIDAQESAGFRDGGWGAIPVTVRDETSSGYLQTRMFDSINVQFMIQTLQTVNSPEFVNPTEENEHEFIVYVGATLTIPLHAKPMFLNEIYSFQMRSIPHRSFTVEHPKEDNGRKGEKVKYSIVNWHPMKSDVGKYIISALVTDTQGSDGLDRNYHVIVKDIGYLPQKDIPHSGPYFPLFPDMNGVVCMIYSTCSFPIYTNTNTPGAFISDVKLTTNTLQTTQIDPAVAITKDGSAMFVSNVTVHPSKSGDQRICFEATENKGKNSAIKCMKVEVKTPDPCRSNPCVHGTCSRQKDSYVCSCDTRHTGQNCENDIDFCASNPCVNNGTCITSKFLHSPYICDCAGTGHVGVNCETDEVDCKLGVCDPHGACKDLDGKFECECFSGYSGDHCDAIDIKCQGVSCQNGGICIVEGGKGVCKCPLGYSGTDCKDDHVILTVNSGTSGTSGTTDDPFTVPSLPSGAELECFVNVTGDCMITLYSKTRNNGTSDVKVGLHSPDVNATVLYSKPDSTTGAVKTLVNITPTTPGLHTLCLNSGSAKTDTLCYKVNAKVYPNTPYNRQMLPKFQPPTPPANSIINCIQGTPCHTLITTDLNILTNNCTLYSGSTSAIVFKTLMSGKNCETNVLFNPSATGDIDVCLQAGPKIAVGGTTFQGERRCFTLKTTASDSCNPNPCTNGGACILQPADTPPNQCICPDTFEGNLCQYQKNCKNSPCQNGGFCETKGNGYSCKCPVNYEGPNCTKSSPTTDEAVVLTKETIIGVAVGTPVSVVGGVGLCTILIKCCLKLNPKNTVDTAIDKLEAADEDEKDDVNQGEDKPEPPIDKPPVDRSRKHENEFRIKNNLMF